LNFLAELRRRNVVRMAGLYLVGAWLVTQVAATLLPVFEAPPWVMKTVVVVLAIGFLAALVFAWMFELTPAGLKRDSEVPPEQSIAPQTARRMDRMLLLVSLLALGYFAFDKFVLAPNRERALVVATTEAVKAEVAVAARPAADPHSIAVLPFVSMSGEADNEFFADGLSEEILNSLSRIDGMQVVGRTSSFQFKGKDEDLRVIGESLGVATLLEGSVRREGARARITAQLIRASDGTHLWSQTYDRTLQDTLAVQLDIAEQVAAALDVALDDAQRARMRAEGVKNVEAFIAYQKGLGLYNDAHNDRKSRNVVDGLRLAGVEFAKAIALEPGFAQAYFVSADLYNHILLMDDRPAAERLNAQREAIRLYGLTAEHSHDAQLRSLALIEAQMLSDSWHGLADRLEAALKQPGCRNPDWMPVFAAAFGYVDLIEDLGKRTSACDPLNGINYNSRTRAALVAGRGQQALDVLSSAERARSLVGAPSIFRARALLMLGRIDEARAELAAIERIDEGVFQTAVIVGTVVGESPASIDARLQGVDRNASIYRQWNNADAIRAAWLGNRAEANRLAAALDARPAGPFLLAVLTSDCLCGAPFDIDAAPRFKARLAESGLRWPPAAAIKVPPRAQDRRP
jgi:TolB-like protein